MKYFNYYEFRCKCLKCKADGTGTHKTLIAKLDTIREKLGKPMIVTSGNRCYEWNKAVGGSVNSLHLPQNGFRAADISCSDSQDRYLLIKYAIEVGGLSVGINPKFIHFDTRPTLSPIIFTY
jgi:uncharacterized protein YcbK (DUF882 family)